MKKAMCSDSVDSQRVQHGYVHAVPYRIADADEHIAAVHGLFFVIMQNDYLISPFYVVKATRFPCAAIRKPNIEYKCAAIKIRAYILDNKVYPHPAGSVTSPGN